MSKDLPYSISLAAQLYCSGRSVNDVSFGRSRMTKTGNNQARMMGLRGYNLVRHDEAPCGRLVLWLQRDRLKVATEPCGTRTTVLRRGWNHSCSCRRLSSRRPCVITHHNGRALRSVDLYCLLTASGRQCQTYLCSEHQRRGNLTRDRTGLGG